MAAVGGLVETCNITAKCIFATVGIPLYFPFCGNAGNSSFHSIPSWKPFERPYAPPGLLVPKQQHWRSSTANARTKIHVYGSQHLNLMHSLVMKDRMCSCEKLNFLYFVSVVRFSYHLALQLLNHTTINLMSKLSSKPC